MMTISSKPQVAPRVLDALSFSNRCKDLLGCLLRPTVKMVSTAQFLHTFLHSKLKPLLHTLFTLQKNMLKYNSTVITKNDVGMQKCNCRPCYPKIGEIFPSIMTFWTH